MKEKVTTSSMVDFFKTVTETSYLDRRAVQSCSPETPVESALLILLEALNLICISIDLQSNGSALDWIGIGPLVAFKALVRTGRKSNDKSCFAFRSLDTLIERPKSSSNLSRTKKKAATSVAHVFAVLIETFASCFARFDRH
jgi:hypothetical protein